MSNSFNIRLVSVLRDVGTSVYEGDEVVFDNTPTLSESGGVEYSPITPVHLPGSIQIYKNTASRTFSIGAKLISRTPAEARDNMVKLQILRSWRMPFFGIGSSTLSSVQKDSRRRQDAAKRYGQDYAPNSREEADAAKFANQQEQDASSRGVELLGAPPEVLYLYAYSNPSGENGRGSPDAGYSYRRSRWVNLHKVPVVLSNLSIQFPEDVDYIPATLNDDYSVADPFPVKMDITIDLLETHSPTEFEKFSLSQFKNGDLVYW